MTYIITHEHRLTIHSEKDAYQYLGKRGTFMRTVYRKGDSPQNLRILMPLDYFTAYSI